MSSPVLIVSLADLDPEALSLAGGKAVQLARMSRGGLPVPPGFCITTDAFRRGMDSELASAVARAYEALGGGPVAVRSSATAEDLPDASFAGQQDTFLNITGAAAVEDAVRACWKSLYTERAVAYRRDHDIPEASAAMAVVVQRMVDAEAAGVLFTLNPVTGALDELVVESALGLGDQVVSARVTPDRYRLSRRAPHGVIEVEGRSTAALLTPERLAGLARLGLAAERLLGRAADIEWAVADGKLWLLQARAVTAAGPRLPEVRYGSQWNAEHCKGRLTIWANHNVRETMPYPHTPFSWSMWNYLTFPEAGKALGLLLPDEDLDRQATIVDLVDGRVYWNMNIMIGFMGILRGPIMRQGHYLDTEVSQISQELFRSGELVPLTQPFSFKRLWNSLRLARLTFGSLLFTTPEQGWKELQSIEDEIASFGKIDLAVMSEEQIVALARYFATQSIPRGFPVLGLGMPAFPAMIYLSKALPKWGFADALPKLLSGLQGNPTMETALALWDVAASAGPEVRSALPFPEALSATEAGRAFLGRVDEFLKTHGHRAVREFDFSCPRWREDPTFIYETIRNYFSHPAGEPTPREHYKRQVREHAEAREAVDRALAGRPIRRWLFRKCIHLIETRLCFREAPKFYALNSLAHIRDLYLEVGRRFVKRGLLARDDDFFFLSIPEIERLTAGQLDAVWARGQIVERRKEFARHMRANPPLVIRSDGKPVRHAAAARPGEVMRGTPVSTGSTRGRARILLDPGDGAALQKGEILVAPFTDPGWTPLFLTAGALVMEIGGIMSHGAVVAREYGIPAVVGVKDATRLLRDGEMLEVDGGAGEVRRIH